MKDYLYAELTEGIQACVFRTLLNIYDGVFLRKQLTAKPLLLLAKKVAS